MPRATYGDDVKARVKRLFAALISLNNLNEDNCGISFKWQESGSLHRKLVLKTTLRHLETLTKKDGLGHLTKTQIREALKQMQNFLGILEDNRLHERGTEIWDFTLKPWFTETAKNLEQFEIEWENRRPEKSKQLATATLKVKSTEYKSQAPSETLFQTSTPSFSTYNPKTWTGREDVIAHLSETLNEGCRVLMLHGLTGIGKTALAERLASDFVSVNGTHALRIPFYRISLDVGNLEQTFSRGAITILQAIGDDTAQKLSDEQLLPYLLQTLERRPCWLQLDSLEYVLHQTEQGAVQFADATWVEFFYQFLTSLRCQQSRMILTSQALPVDLVERCERSPQLWCEFHLRGLEAKNWLDLFRNYGVSPQTVGETDYLCNIAQHFDGHPLILKMIAGDIRKPLFGGSVAKYWHDYYSHRQPLQIYQSQEQRARNWVNLTLQQLSDTPRQMLQRCAVYRRAVPESFYLTMMDASDDRTAALLTLKSRYLVEEEDIQAEQLFIRQHNLIRDVAYAQLKINRPTWVTAQRKAADLWLTVYEPVPDSKNLEKVRGYLEAFDHYYEIEDWKAASDIFTNEILLTHQELHQQLYIWSYYQELIRISNKLVNRASPSIKILCLLKIGNSHHNLGINRNAINYYQQALVIVQENSDRSKEMLALSGLGTSYNYLGQYDQAIEYHQQELAIAREISDRYQEGLALGKLGIVSFHRLQYEQAIKFFEQELAIAREVSDRFVEAVTLGKLGLGYFYLNQYERAIEFYQQYLSLSQEVGHSQGEQYALGGLGHTYHCLGQYERAIKFYQQTLSIAQEIGDIRGQGIVLVNWGRTLIELKQYSEASLNLKSSLKIFSEIGDKANEAETFRILAELHYKNGQSDQAQQYCEQALALNTPLRQEYEELMERIKGE